MNDASANLKWEEPREWLDHLAQLAGSSASRHVVRIAVGLLWLAIPIGLALQNIWFLLPVAVCLGTIWHLRGRLILHRLGLDVRDRVEISEKKIRISHLMGITWIPLKKFTEYSISDWKLGSYVGDELRMRSRRGGIELWVGIPAGFDISGLQAHLDSMGLKRSFRGSIQPVPPPLPSPQSNPG